METTLRYSPVLYDKMSENRRKCEKPAKRMEFVTCANCGGKGHYYKNCHFPITSYGMICYRIRCNPKNKKTFLEFVLVQRKDSLNYVEFLKGKYDLDKRSYIMKMFSNMTEDERTAIKNNDFVSLWSRIWKMKHVNWNDKDFKESRKKFDMIKNGYILDTEHEGLIFFNIDYILQNTTSTIKESEWGFPKGRKNLHENNLQCAFREFCEETALHPQCIQLCNFKPLEEVFTGSNKVRYRHQYYLAYYDQSMMRDIPEQWVHKKIDTREIKDIRWVTLKEGLSMIRERNVERKELFQRAHNMILKNMFVLQ